MLPTDINPDVKNKNCSTTLYAIWEPNTLSVLYNVNGGTINSATYYANYSNGYNGTIFTKNDNSILIHYWNYDTPQKYGLYDGTTFGLVKEGYTFKGWSTSKNGDKVFSDKNNELVPSQITSDLYYGNETKILYAVWEKNKAFEVSQPLEHFCIWNNGKISKNATCKTTGVKTYTCTLCGQKKTETIAKKSHTYKSYTTKATTSKNGSIETKCVVCGNVSKSTTIYYTKTITLSATSYTYNGKVNTPSVTVKDSKGETLKKNTDYTVTYSKGRKAVGKYNVTIKFKGNYSGTVTKTFTIIPKSTSITKLTVGKKKFTVRWKKLTSQATGYQIQYSTDKNLKKNNKTVTVSKNSTTSKSISKLSAKKKYYVRIRTYKTVKVNGKNTKIYS
ncbi:MAG: fibronectin type III domain-containing protein, partial [Acetobacter sp.]|nr:fibronectin type III domain-containing protein [Acetobacter sp.]